VCVCVYRLHVYVWVSAVIIFTPRRRDFSFSSCRTFYNYYYYIFFSNRLLLLSSSSLREHTIKCAYAHLINAPNSTRETCSLVRAQSVRTTQPRWLARHNILHTRTRINGAVPRRRPTYARVDRTGTLGPRRARQRAFYTRFDVIRLSLCFGLLDGPTGLLTIPGRCLF